MINNVRTSHSDHLFGSWCFGSYDIIIIIDIIYLVSYCRLFKLTFLFIFILSIIMGTKLSDFEIFFIIEEFSNIYFNSIYFLFKIFFAKKK